MYNVKDIKDRLANGENLDDIANEMTNILNQAKQERDQEIKEAEAKAREAQARAIKEQEHARKTAKMHSVAVALMEYIEEFYPDLVDEFDEKEISETIQQTVEEMVVALEAAAQAMGALKMFYGRLGAKDTNPQVKLEKAPTNAGTQEEILQRWINSIC